MLQKNSFFSRPVIFFGSHLEIEEEEEIQDDEWNFSDPWIVSLSSEIQRSHQNKIGLFILWSDPDETESESHFS